MRLGQLYLLLATTLLLCNAAIAPLTSASNSTYIDIPIDLTSNENSTLQTEIYGSFIALNESNPFDIAPNLAAAFLREYSDGSREFYLYVDTVDASGNTHEYVGVVSVNDNDTVFTVISFVEIQVANTPSSSSANATTLAAFIDGFASGYSKYTQSQID
jgi:ribonuclease PH